MAEVCKSVVSLIKLNDRDDEFSFFDFCSLRSSFFNDNNVFLKGSVNAGVY
jgi:hypothetical protein